jgi:hypothetical protein
MSGKNFGSKRLSMSGSGFQFDLSDSQRREQLEQKLSTIDKKLNTLRSSSSASSLSAPREDNSYTIDYMSPQITSCPHCFQNMPARDLRKHMAKFCKDKIVTCQEIGCGLVLPQGEMKKHLTHGCKIAKQRRLMATSAIKRKEDIRESALAHIESLTTAHRAVTTSNNTASATTLPSSPKAGTSALADIDFDMSTYSRAIPKDEYSNCPACNDRVRTDEIKSHSKKACRMRTVYCSNRHLGCVEEVPLSLIPKHLRCDCVVEKRKDELVARSRQRYENVKCTGCAEMVPLMYLQKHEQEECKNRKVPCRNHLLGCEVLVRLKDRKNHEDVSNSIKPRSCLFFDGCDTVMELNEDDIPPPWTIEYWVYRPSLLESARCYLREVQRLSQVFLEAVFAECRIKAQIMEIKESIKTIAANEAMAAAQSAKKTGGRNDALLPASELAAVTVKLAGMIQGYEDVTVEAIKRGQLYLVAMRTALAEIEVSKGIRDHKELLNISPEVDGVPCRQSYKEISLLAGTGAAKSREKVGGSTRGSTRASKSSSAINEETCSPPLGNVMQDESADQVGDTEEVGDEAEEGEGEGASAGDGEAVDGGIDDADGDVGDVEEEAGVGAAKEEEEMVDIPPGYERIITNPHDFDWGPKLWKEWGAMIKDMVHRLVSDEEVMRELRIESGLIRETEKKKKKKKDSGEEQGEEGDDPKAKKEKKSKKEKKEKKRKLDKNLKGESRFTEVAAAVKNLYQGTEPLCMSENSAIYMNMSNALTTDDVQGHIGICDSVLGMQSFNMNIPREQWTHVAIICTVEPKKRLMLYCDGGLVSTIKDMTFDLPMKSIGAPHMSLHGYMLDVRYWAKARSVPEIKLDMRCLLRLSEENKQDPQHTSKEGKGAKDDKGVKGGKVPPQSESDAAAAAATSSDPDLTGDGLVAWWTFEEGGFSTRASDVSDHRFPTLITGGKIHRGKRKTPWFEAGSMLPLTVREHLMAAATSPQGQRAPAVITPQITVPLPSYLERNLCPFEVRRAKLAQRGRALLQEKKCPNECCARVRKGDMRFHLKFECSRRRVTCRHHWCGATFFAEEQHEHDSESCALVVARERVLERAMETTAVLQCTDCSAKIQARHMLKHMEQACPYRKMKCPHPDCGEEFPAHQKKKHFNYSCKSEFVTKKKWLIKRARERINYPRPWGIEFNFSNDDEVEDEAVDYSIGKDGNVESKESNAETDTTPL